MADSSKEPESSGDFPPGWAPEPAPKSKAKRHGNARWILPLIALGVVAAVVVAAVLVINHDEEPTSTAASTPARMSTPAPTTPASASAEPNAIASAQDMGPVGIIASDVTCQSWREIQSTMASAQSNGWDQRDPSIPGAAWTPEQRSQYEQVGTAMRTSADKAVGLARQTPNRVMRELYETFIAYGRAYATALADYQPVQNFLAQTNTAALQSVSEICAAADGGSAISRAPTVPPAAPPTAPAPAADPANPERFLPESGPTCARWVPAEAALSAGIQPWLALDPELSVDRFTPDQRAVLESTAGQFTAAAGTLEADGRGSGNPVFEDYATLAAQYFRAFAAAVPTYAAADRNLGMVGVRLDNLISSACQAAGAP
jgi:hypothetical protein